MVLLVEASTKFFPVAFALTTDTVIGAGGMKLNVGMGGGGAPGVENVSGIEGPTPTLYVVLDAAGSV
jgi:hypothetical protein